MVPIVSAEGVKGCALIEKLGVGKEVHPAAFVTEKEYEPGVKPEIVAVAPVPAIFPGLSTQFPEGNPPSVLLPVATEQVGCILLTNVGVEGVADCTLITTFADGSEVQLIAFVTVKLYVPEDSPDRVVLGPVPAIAPGFKIQLPAGKPLSITLPVDTEQVGCVVVPTTGATGTVLIVTTTFPVILIKQDVDVNVASVV